MVVLRNRISAVRAGGPRQYAELRDRVLIKADSGEAKDEVVSELDRIGMKADALMNSPVVSAEPHGKIEDVLHAIERKGSGGTKIRQGIKEIREARKKDENFLETSVATVAATRELINEISGLPRVNLAEFVRTEADFGPENLRMSPDKMETITPSEAEEMEDTLQDMVEAMGVPEVWEVTRGENAIVAIFDTGFSEDLISSGRTIHTFSAGDTDSAYESSEGHGTMCAGAAAASAGDGRPFDGVAPAADVILVRITDSEGQIRSDIIAKAWDWLVNLDLSKPVVANHSYGTPLCSGRPRQKFCDSVANDVVKTANAQAGITSVYAAGNEAMQCGHRPSGLTNAITGTNSLAEVITVGALLSNGKEAQNYSSHGRGDCAPIADPKPNVSAPIPKFTYYGGEDGWKIKDMSFGVFGSGGGTSHASPQVTGAIALLQSAAVKGELPQDSSSTARRMSRNSDGAMQTEEIKQILHDTSEPPHRSLVNSVGLFLSKKGYDARFGHGKINITEAIKEV